MEKWKTEKLLTYVLLCIVALKAVHGYSYMTCKFLCENVDINSRYSCEGFNTWDTESRSIVYYMEKSWIATDITTLLMNNTRLCSNTMKIPSSIFRKFDAIEVFHMNDSNIDEISYSDFRRATRLANLSVSHNAIADLPSNLFSSCSRLKFVDLSFNQIKVIAEDAFERELDHGGAEDVLLINMTFLGIRHLYLHHNSIEHLALKTFSSLKNLEILTLNNNLLQEIDGNALFGQNLKLINFELNSNQLTKLTNFEAFSLMPNLIFFNISDNPKIEHTEFTVHSEYADITSTNISVLIIGDRVHQLHASHNKINQIFRLSDSQSVSPLVELHLAHNLLTSIQNLTDFPNLRTLDMSHNSLGMVDKRIFELMPQLANLSLAYNQFDTFDSEIFKSNITLLDVSYNNLKNLDLSIKTDRLEVLSVDGNHLTSIDVQIKTNMPSLRQISIANNDWNCQYLTQTILVLMMDEVQIARAVFDRKNNNRNYDTHVKGIGCFNKPIQFNANQINTKNQLKKEIETIIEQNLLAFELKMCELIQHISEENLNATNAKLNEFTVESFKKN